MQFIKVALIKSSPKKIQNPKSWNNRQKREIYLEGER